MTHIGKAAVLQAASYGSGAATLPARLDAQARHRGRGIAVLHRRHGRWERWTWQDLAAASCNIAGALARFGIAPGEPVAIAGATTPRLLAAFYACHRVGAVPLLVPQAGAGVALAQALATHAVRLVFAAGDHEVHAIATRPQQAPIVVSDDARGLGGAWAPWLRRWDDVESPGVSPTIGHAANPDDVAAIMCTTDGDGQHDWVSPTHAHLLSQADEIAHRHSLGQADVAFLAVPIGWPEGLLLGPVAALAAGAALAIPETDATVLADLRDVAPTILVGPAGMFRALRQHAFLSASRAAWPWRTMLLDGLSLAGTRTSGFARAVLAGAVRDRLGLGRVRTALAFGDPLPPQVDAFFTALRMKIDRAPAEPAREDDDLRRLESVLRGSVYIRDACAIRTAAGQPAALVALDVDAVAAWAARAGHAVTSTSDLHGITALPNLIGDEIARLVSPDRSMTFAIAAEAFSFARGELSQSGSLLRPAATRRHAAELAALYGGGGHRPDAEAPSDRSNGADINLLLALQGGV